MDILKKRVGSLKDGREKDFLKDALKKRNEAVKKLDKQKLEMLLNRVNYIYDGLSIEAQGIATYLIKIVMEDISEC